MKKRGHIKGERYCGNFMTREVHDLHNEQQSCGIDVLSESGNEIPLASLEVAKRLGYSNCKNCLFEE